MHKLEIEGHGVFEVEDGTRLVSAIKAAGSDILHRCGGFAKCTTCKVDFQAGEPAKMTTAEREKLQEQENLGAFRLACQCLVESDMQLKVLMTLSESGLDDAGPEVEAAITPEPEWVS